MGGRFDAGDIQFLQFFDVAEDPAELGAEFSFLVGGELQPREVRDIGGVKLGRGHGSKLKSKT